LIAFQGLGIAPSIDEVFNLDPLNTETFVANDFTVELGTIFALQQISLSTNQVQAPDHGVFNIREYNNGIPGEIIQVIEADVTSAIAYAAAFNEPVYHVVFDLDEAVVFNEGVYWLEPKVHYPSAFDSLVGSYCRRNRRRNTHVIGRWRCHLDSIDWFRIYFLWRRRL